MDNKAVLKKKRELLYNFNKRKLSLRKTMDNLKQSECRLDISQITKCVFLGSLALKPVPHLFDCPTMLADYEKKLWSGEDQVQTINDENTNEKQTKVVTNIQKEPEIDNTGCNDKVTIKTDNNNKRTLNRRYSKGKRLLSDKKDKSNKQKEQQPQSCINIIQQIDLNKEIILHSDIKITPEASTTVTIPPPSSPEASKPSTPPPTTTTTTTTTTVESNKEIIGEVEPEAQPQSIEPAEILPPIENNNETNESSEKTLTDLENVDMNEDLDSSICNLEDFDETTPTSEIIVLKQVVELPLGIRPPEGLEILPFDSDTVLTPLQPVNPYTIPTDHHQTDILSEIDDPPSSDSEMEPELMFDLVNIKMEREVFDMQLYNNQFQQRLNQELNINNQTTATKIDNNTVVIEKADINKINTINQSITNNLKRFKRTPQCKICSQIFPSYRMLKRHRLQHEGEKPYLCLQCGVNQDSLEQLIAHLRTHKGEYPYVCKKCNQGFKTLNALEAHQPVHVLKKVVEPKKMFQCEVCSKEFKKLCDLERHTRVHTGEKPSVCNICNQRFQQAHNLNKHLLIHTQEKPFQCDICNKKFGRNDVLSRHLLTHSVSKPNHCAYCMKSFIRSSQLMAHVDKYHNQQAANVAI